MSELEIKILIEEESLERFTEILAKLNSEGFVERTAFEQIGIIFGIVPSAQFESLSQIDGILKVSSEQTFEAFTNSDVIDATSENTNKRVKLEEE